MILSTTATAVSSATCRTLWIALSRISAMRFSPSAVRAEIQKEIDAATARADAEISARAAEGEKRIAEIRESAIQSVRQVAEETAVAVVDRIMPGVAEEDAVRSAVQARLG